MPCNSDHLNATNTEIEASKLVALIEEIQTGKLPDYFGNGYYKEIYNKVNKKFLDEKTSELCSLIQNMPNSIITYSLELQLWWRDHQKIDKERLEKEINTIVEANEKQIALSKLSKHERDLLKL